jgi:hypothetical protein
MTCATLNIVFSVMYYVELHDAIFYANVILRSTNVTNL